jgi:peptidoglycan/LPS O-acetylase OafA/YrhL
MFGSLRFFLAYLVVLSHLTGSVYAHHLGYYAVRAFFVISGFVITSALNEVYQFDGARFWTNRLLRLLPPYYMVWLLTLIAVILLPVESGQYLSAWHHGKSLHDWTLDGILNLLVIPLQFAAPEFRLIPPYWSIAIEIEMYLVLYLLAARNIRLAAAVLAVGICYHVVEVLLGSGWGARYYTAAGAMMPFASGALIYFLGKRNLLRVTPGMTMLAFGVWLANLVLAGWTLPESFVFGTGYYLNSIVFMIVVAGLAQNPFGTSVARIDRTLGEIAYPVFLSQWLVGFIVALMFFPGIWRGWTLTLVATPFIIVAGFGLALLNRRFVEPARTRLRAGRSADALQYRHRDQILDAGYSGALERISVK